MKSMTKMKIAALVAISTFACGTAQEKNSAKAGAGSARVHAPSAPLRLPIEL